MILTPNGTLWKWRCNHYVSTSAKKGRVKTRCAYSVSLYTGTFFSKSHLSAEIICKFVNFWLYKTPLTVISQQLHITGHCTLIDWAHFCREVCVKEMLENRQPIGGEGKTVEIDESKFGKRKYNKGKRVEGIWVFGAFDRETGQCFMVPVERRDSATLLPIIRDWILPGSTIISDCWKAYDCLNDYGYEHLQVNHSLNYKDPETGAHTNSIEGSWAQAKKGIPSGGRRKYFMAGYLARFMFLRMCKAKGLDPFIEFCRSAGRLYNPLIPVPEEEDEEEGVDDAEEKGVDDDEEEED